MKKKRFNSFVREYPETEARMAELSPYDEYLAASRSKSHSKFRLSREERDHIAGHALDSIGSLCSKLSEYVQIENSSGTSSNTGRRIAALSNLLGDIGWEREHALSSVKIEEGKKGWEDHWLLGELFPVAQLRPWLEEWQRQDDEALVQAQGNLEVGLVAEDDGELEVRIRQVIADAQTKLGTGAILLARLEKWMASHGN